MPYDKQVCLFNYQSIQPKLNKREHQVYEALCVLGEATSWEILQYLKIGFNPNYVRPRLTDLMNKTVRDTEGTIYNMPMVEKLYQVSQADSEGNQIKQWVWRAIK